MSESQRRSRWLALAVASAGAASVLTVVEPGSAAAADCKDVFVLAVPGTGETSAKANPEVVPGMLSKVTLPLKAAVTNGTPIAGPAAAPAQIGQETASEMAEGIGSLVGGLLDTAVTEGLADVPADGDLGAGRTTTTQQAPSTQSAEADPTAAPATWSGGGPRIKQVDTSSTAPSTSNLWGGESTAENDGGGDLGKTVGFEQIPYVAEVGGPVAGMVTGAGMTLGESRKAGTESLNKRLKEIAEKCPTSEVAAIGYSQGALILGDVLSDIGNGKGPISATRIIAGGLLSDPARTPTTANLDVLEAPEQQQVIPGSETFVGPNVAGQGIVGARPAGFGVLADRVTSFCAEGDGICSITSKSPAIAAVVPLVNLRQEDIGPYAISRVTTLLTNIATTPPADMQRAITSVSSAVMSLSAAGASNPYAIPLELARIVFASSTLDDVGRVVRMPEYDAFLSLTKPDQLVTQAVDIAGYALMGAHTSYDRKPVNAQGDSATTFLAKWLLGRIESA